MAKYTTSYPLCTHADFPITIPNKRKDLSVELKDRRNIQMDKMILENKPNTITQTMGNGGLQIAGNVSGNNQITVNISSSGAIDKLINRYELILSEKDKRIIELEEENKLLKSKIKGVYHV